MQIKSFSLGELSSHIGAELKGDPDCLISSPAPLDIAGVGQITFLRDDKYKNLLSETKASAIILQPKNMLEKTSANLLLLENPYLGFIKIINLMCAPPKPTPGVHATAVLGKNCDIAKTANIAANVVIGDNVCIGEHTIISANCTIGHNARVGDDVCIYPNVVLYDNVRLGNRVIVHSGAIIGADGFGMLNDNGIWVKVPQIGSVVIGDDVEIGASTTIDRGTLGDTEIGDGVKLDNQIQIAHNVCIGAHTLMAGGTMVAGSAKIGKHCMFGGRTSVADHAKIADHVILTGTTAIPSDISEPGIYSSGMLPQSNSKWRRNAVRLLQLDDMAKRLKDLEKRLKEIE
ncbi:MAG: UDP-3-O-(3-hydroxymyristoyl)glucosamine N-acyltransferase [Gammaproteobacteria bacterium]|jgi:UDP-3-O-[3-hydroxymyristoyl] glucosamine N-acyltransferase|nr:UDP-3-O-(3-hydroxymyristoyl)glucosamine N-acyltransferase [Gammaproteobacteria bacterium]